MMRIAGGFSQPLAQAHTLSRLLGFPGYASPRSKSPGESVRVRFQDQNRSFREATASIIRANTLHGNLGNGGDRFSGRLHPFGPCFHGFAKIFYSDLEMR